MRRIAVATVARSDYGLYRPLLRALAQYADVSVQLLIGGSHLAPSRGLTVREIEADGYDTSERVPMELDSDARSAVAQSFALGVLGFSNALERIQPDLLVALGDRIEMLAAVCAALPLNVPVAHLHGGELSLGAIDDAIRHAVTKLSHLHFVATSDYGRRVAQLGEEPWRIHVTGALSIDNALAVPALSWAEVKRAHGLNVDPPFLLMTLHPTTLEHEQNEAHARELLRALAQLQLPSIITAPNSDAGSRYIAEQLRGYAQSAANETMFVESLGGAAYLQVMKHCAAVVGNSSSGIVEAGAFRVPVVNIGSRQDGRQRGPNIIDTPAQAEAIVAAVRRALSADFRATIADMSSPFGDGAAARRIAQILSSVPLDARLLRKGFVDLPVPALPS